MENQQSRPMFDVDEVCSNCNVAITQLPFQPDPARKNTLRCRDCWRKSRDSQTSKSTRSNF